MAQTNALDRRWIGWTRHSTACFVAISVTAPGDARCGPAVAGGAARRTVPSAMAPNAAAPDEIADAELLTVQ